MPAEDFKVGEEVYFVGPTGADERKVWTKKIRGTRREDNINKRGTIEEIREGQYMVNFGRKTVTGRRERGLLFGCKGDHLSRELAVWAANLHFLYLIRCTQVA